MFPGIGYFATTAAPAPTLSAGTTLSSTTGNNSTTWSAAFTSSTGKVLVRASGRVQATTLSSVTFKVGAVTLTTQVARYGLATQAVGQDWVYVGTATGVATGSALDVVCTSSGVNLNRHIVMVNDISASWGGTVGGSGSDVISASGTASITASGTAAGNARLWVGMSNFLDAAASPQTSNSWTSDGELSSAGSEGSSNDGAFWHLAGPGAGSTQTLTGTSAVGNTSADLGCAVLELL